MRFPPVVGTWKLNVEKSKLGSGAVRAQTLKFESTPAGIKLTSDGTDPLDESLPESRALATHRARA